MANNKARSKRPNPPSGPRTGATARKAAPPPASPLPMPLLGAGLVIGVVAMLPAFFTGGIHLRRSVELVDHVVPGIVVLALVLLAILRNAKPESFMLGAGVGILLAGFWMIATHAGLASQALDGQASKLGAAYHCATALAVEILGLVWAWRYRTAAAAGPSPAPAARKR